MLTMRICLRIAARAKENWFSRSPSTAQHYQSAVTGVKGNCPEVLSPEYLIWPEYFTNKPLEIMLLQKNRLVKLAGN
jgi:hypothetical protein